MFECRSCKLNYKELQNNYCIFCNIVLNNKKSDIYNICIGYTNLTQNDIIKNTYNNIILENKIPYPQNIDNKVILININPYIFREFILYIQKDEINIIDKFKLFFTNTIDLNKVKLKKFPLKYKIEKLNINYIKTESTLKDIDTNIAELYEKFIHKLYYNE